MTSEGPGIAVGWGSMGTPGPKYIMAPAGGGNGEDP